MRKPLPRLRGLASLGAVAAVLIALIAPARAAAPQPGTIFIKSYAVDTVVDPEGTVVTSSRREIQATTDAAAAQIGTAPLIFRDDEHLEIEEAYTLKADGRRLDVNPAAILAQQPEGDGSVFMDVRRKVIIFPDVRAGDSVVYRVKHTSKSWFPRAFYTKHAFPRLMPYGEVTITITAPRAMKLKFEAKGASLAQTASKDTITTTWRYSDPSPPAKPDADMYGPDMPRLIASSFADYDALGHAYAALVDGKDAVTPAIQAKADELTRGIADRREQAARIYDWVSRNVRYVSIAFGINSIVPHDPGSTLANGYGDCKDKAVLLSTLLRAKGIASALVLINAESNYELPAIATPFAFNHVIVWIPDLDTYADPTSGLAAFGTLPFGTHGKPVVHAVRSGTTRYVVPTLAPDAATARMTTVAYMDTSGEIAGETMTSGTGPMAALLRGVRELIETTGPEKYAAGYFGQFSSRGSGTFDLDDDGAALTQTMTIKGRFRESRVKWPTRGGRFHIAPGIRLIGGTTDVVIGRLARNTDFSKPGPCISIAQAEEFTVVPPPGFVVAELPETIEAATPHVRFRSHWTRNERAVTVTREIRSTVTGPTCDGAVRQEIARALRTAEKTYQQTLYLKPAQDGVESNDVRLDERHLAEIEAAMQAHPDNPVLIATRGFYHADKGEYALALRDLDEAIKLHPDYGKAHAARGHTRLLDYEKAAAKADAGELAAAVADLSEAIRLDPENGTAYELRARARILMKDNTAALADLNDAVSRDIATPYGFATRGWLLVREKKYREAIADFDQALADRPDDPHLLESRGVAFAAMGDREKALADYKRVRALVPNHRDIESLIADAERMATQQSATK